MLFVPESLYKKRRKLLREVERGALTATQAFQRSLQLDPFDWLALMDYGRQCLLNGDAEGAYSYFWRALEAEPQHSEPYIILAATTEAYDLELSGSLSPIALRRVVNGRPQTQPWAQKWIEAMRKKMEIGDEPFPDIVRSLPLDRPGEPRRVSTLLAPYRLIQDVIDRPTGGMSREAVDGIVEMGSACVPLLIGVLRGWARELSPEYRDGFSAAAALALLGEIGDPAVLPVVPECLPVEDEEVLGAAIWTATRLGPELRYVPKELRELSIAMEKRTVYDICCIPLEEIDKLEEEDSLDLDEEEPPVLPAPRRGSNDPCWCGSGKKYKKCHLTADEQLRSRASSPASPRDSSVASLIREFLSSHLEPGEILEALALFLGRSSPIEEMSPAEQTAFFDWLMNDYTPRHLKRPAPQEYLARHGKELSTADRVDAESWARSRGSLFEVQRVERGVGVELKDLLLGDSFFVRDAVTANTVALGDRLFARVRPDRDGMAFTATGLRMTPLVCRRVRDWIAADRETFDLDWPSYLRANSHRIYQQFGEMFMQQLSETLLVTPEGDEMVLSKANYKVLDRARAIEGLESSELIGGRRDESGIVRWTWFESAETSGEERRVLGSLRLQGERLVLECNSRQRLERGVALIRSLAASALEERLTDFQSPQAAMRDTASRNATTDTD